MFPRLVQLKYLCAVRIQGPGHADIGIQASQHRTAPSLLHLRPTWSEMHNKTVETVEE